MPVKAIVRVVSWRGALAEIWIEEEYMGITSSDVVADFHVWKDRKPQPAGDVGKSESFALIETSDGSGSPPKVSEPPQWRYQKPPDFESAEAGRIDIIKCRSIGQVSQQLPIAVAERTATHARAQRKGPQPLETC